MAVRCGRGGVSVGWVPESTRCRVGCLEGHAAWLGGYEAHLLRAICCVQCKRVVLAADTPPNH